MNIQKLIEKHSLQVGSESSEAYKKFSVAILEEMKAQSVYYVSTWDHAETTVQAVPIELIEKQLEELKNEPLINSDQGPH